MRGMAFACWPGPVVPACLRIVRPHGRGRRISPSGAIGGTVTGHGGASTRRTVAARRIRWTRRARVHGKGIRPKADAGAGSQEGGVSRGAAPQRARLQGYGSQQGVRPQGRHLPPGIKARLRRLRAGYRVRRGVGVLEYARYSVHDKTGPLPDFSFARTAWTRSVAKAPRATRAETISIIRTGFIRHPFLKGVRAAPAYRPRKLTI